MKKFQLKLSYISSVVYRVLPSMKYNLHKLTYLYSDKNIKSYFNNIRIYQEYPGLYNIFNSFGFDMSLCDKVRNDRSFTKTSFLKNVKEASSTFCNPIKNLKLCKINQSELNFVSHKFPSDILQNSSSHVFPTYDDVINSVNLSASQGLPNPFVKKRDIFSDLERVLSSFYSKVLKPSDLYKYPSAIFMRPQIRGSGLKFRIVHAVQAKQQIIESFFYKYFFSCINNRFSSLSIGLTQLEVSDVLSRYTDYHTYCLDYSKWDILRQPVLSVISFSLISQSLGLSQHSYFYKMLISCRNYYLTLPTFHPSIELKRRHIGTVSGSGFTSLDNSLCNWIQITILIHRYCISKNIDPYTFDYKVNVCGDDLILGFKTQVDINSFINKGFHDFNSKLRLECEPAKPGTFNYFFLGSNWINGKPFRDEKILVASTVFGSGDFPKMSTQELFQSRFFEIFGNSSDTLYYWKRIRLYDIPLKRLFFFYELFSPFKRGNEFTRRNSTIIRRIEERSAENKDRRGFWFNTSLNHDVISLLWETR